MMQSIQGKETFDQDDNEDSLFARYGSIIFAYLRLHTVSREDAEDLTVEVFVAALENANLRDIPDELKLAWLRRVAHNKYVDHYRYYKRRSLIALEQLEQETHYIASGNPERVALQRESFQQLQQAVQELPQIQQQILRLRYQDGLRFAEIAGLVQKREDHVRKLLSRALAALRGSIQREGER